jgi:hypothetical protein
MTNRVSIYRVLQDGSAILRENVSWGKLRRYRQKYLHLKLNGYEGNYETRFKEWELLYIY